MISPDEGCPALLHVQQLTKGFGGRTVIRDVSFTVESGNIVVLAGPNGSGKSTLLNLISGVVAPDCGDIRLSGRSLLGMSCYQRARLGIRRTFQSVRLFDSQSVLENVLFAVRDTSEERVWSAIAQRSAVSSVARDRGLEIIGQVGLQDKALEPARLLSFGQRKLLTFAMAVANGPPLLLLDEPFAGVHAIGIVAILTQLSALKARNVGIVCVEHRMQELREVADFVMMLSGEETAASFRTSAVES